MVINELKKNSDRSINEIAEKCGFSRQKVWRIIKRLKKNKDIWGYGAVVDEEKQGSKYYILLLKRSIKPMEKNIIKNITSREIEESINNIGCEMVYSLYTQGSFDWVIIFTAPDKIQAKKVNEIFIDRYHEFLTEAKLLETIFPAKVQCFLNPNIKKLENLFQNKINNLFNFLLIKSE